MQKEQNQNLNVQQREKIDDKSQTSTSHFKSRNDEGLYDFMILNMNKLEPAKLMLREKTQQLFPEDAVMLTAPDQCELMRTMIKLGKCKYGLEVGCFTGYSALCMAQGIQEGGMIHTIDITDKYSQLAKEHWKFAGLQDKITLHVNDGLSQLKDFLKQQQKNQLYKFDFAYVDANKLEYQQYFEVLAFLIKDGGFIMFDNILWKGRVKDEASRDNDPKAKAAYETARMVLNDERFDTNTFMIGDGLMIATKKSLVSQKSQNQMQNETK
eukprot:403357136